MKMSHKKKKGNRTRNPWIDMLVGLDEEETELVISVHPHMSVRDTVKARDHNRCQHPGCGARATELHHILFRKQHPERKNDVENLVSLCEDHHKKLSDSPHKSDSRRRYWEKWSEGKYPLYWERVRARMKITH